MAFKRGFSLIELGVVFLILALISAISLTGVSQLRQKNNLQIQQNNIEEDLLLAKALAQSRYQNVDIVFFEDGYTMQAGDELKVKVLPKPFTVSSLRLGFNSAGNPRFSGTLYLYRHGKSVAKMTVAVGSGLINWSKI